MKTLMDEIRLLIAETLIIWAAKVTPRKHEDSKAIYRALFLLDRGGE